MSSAADVPDLKRCRWCGQTFRKREHVVRHERSHSGERPFVCGTCGDSFSRQDTLLRHTRIHANKGEDEHGVGRPGPTGSRRRTSGRTSGTSTPRSRHQSPNLGPLTALDGLGSPSSLSLRHDSSNASSRAASPLINRLPDPPALASAEGSTSHLPLFAPSHLSTSYQPHGDVPQFNLESPELGAAGDGAPALRRKRSRSSSDSDSVSDSSLLSYISPTSPRAPISRDASSTRLSEQVERWAPLGPGLVRSINLPISDARSRPPSPTTSPVGSLPARSASSPGLVRYNGMFTPLNLGASPPGARSGESDSDSRSGSSVRDFPRRITPLLNEVSSHSALATSPPLSMAIDRRSLSPPIVDGTT